jgi:SAM-dependent methyltransferase
LGVQPNTLIIPPKLLPLFLRDEMTTPVPSGIMVRRDMNAAIGGFEESFRSIYDDQVYLAKLGLRAPVFAADTCWHWYRQHPDQRCRVTAQTGQYHRARLAFLQWLEAYLSGQAVTDSEVWAVLRQELWPYRHPNLHRWREQMKRLVKCIVRRIVPLPVRRRLRPLWHGQRYRPPVGYVLFGHLRRLQPISRVAGSDRGRCIDRYYIEKFLGQHRDDIQGHVLEIGNDIHARRFGGDRVTQSDVLRVQQVNPNWTGVAGLTNADAFRADTFDCIILPQTLQRILDVQKEVQGLYHTLKPGGVLLATCLGVGQTNRWGDYWRFTTRSARQLFEEVFPAANVQVEAFGNVLVATAFLHGLAAEELRQAELDHHDPDYEVLIAVRAVKPQAGD